MDITNNPNRHVASQPWFDHHKLDAYNVALEAMIAGMAIAKELPKGYGKLKDQLERALQGALLQTTEAAARTGADRLARFRAARAEACESAGIVEALERLKLVEPEVARTELRLLWRLTAMLTRLAKIRR